MFFNMRYIAFIVVLVFMSSCTSKSEGNVPIVTVGDNSLYISQIRAQMPPNVGSNDSTIFAEEYIRRWVSQQVVFQKAESYLSDDVISIEACVDDYRNSLYVEKYYQRLIDQKFKPNISDEAIQSYYDSMKQNFILEDALMKGIFAILPKKCPDFNDMKKCISKHSEDDMLRIEQYIYKYAVKSEMAFDKWLPVASIRKSFIKPMLANENSILSSKKLYVTSDDDYNYLLISFEYCKADEIAPLEYVRNKIYTILVNKEKNNFINKKNIELYNEALKTNKIHYYEK